MPAAILAERRLGAATTLQIVQGNLLEEPVDAIVNAATACSRMAAASPGSSRARQDRPLQHESGPDRRRAGPVSNRIGSSYDGGQSPVQGS